MHRHRAVRSCEGRASLARHVVRARHSEPRCLPCVVQGSRSAAREPDTPKAFRANLAGRVGADLKAGCGLARRRTFKGAAKRSPLPLPSRCAWRSVRSGPKVGRTGSCRCRRPLPDREELSRRSGNSPSFDPPRPLPGRHSSPEFHHAFGHCPVHPVDMRVIDHEEGRFRMRAAGRAITPCLAHHDEPAAGCRCRRNVQPVTQACVKLGADDTIDVQVCRTCRKQACMFAEVHDHGSGQQHRFPRVQASTEFSSSNSSNPVRGTSPLPFQRWAMASSGPPSAARSSVADACRDRAVTSVVSG